MKKLAVITTSLLFTTPVFAQSVGEKSGVNSALSVSPSTADFVKEAAISDVFEIQSSQLAAQRANEPQMITDHQKTSNELKSKVQSGKTDASVPSDLDSSHQKMLDKLKGLNGADFTKQYDKGQVSAHKDAGMQKAGDDAALKDWAGKTLPDLERHLEMLEK